MQRSRELCERLPYGHVNPVFIFAARLGLLAMPRFLAGVGMMHAIAFPCLGVVGILSPYFIARKLFGRRHATISALALSFLPAAFKAQRKVDMDVCWCVERDGKLVNY